MRHGQADCFAFVCVLPVNLHVTTCPNLLLSTFWLCFGHNGAPLRCLVALASLLLACTLPATHPDLSVLSAFSNSCRWCLTSTFSVLSFMYDHEILCWCCIRLRFACMPSRRLRFSNLFLFSASFFTTEAYVSVFVCSSLCVSFVLPSSFFCYFHFCCF